MPPTPRKSVHYEEYPPPPPHFPLPPPFNQRMIGFGCPDITVPVGYLGPRKVEWPQEKGHAEISNILQADLVDGKIEKYDLNHVNLRGSAMKEACLVWKQPVRRASVRVIDLSATHLNDAGVDTFAKFIAQAPSAIAPLQLQSLTLNENGIWSKGMGELLQAFAKNTYSSVQELYLSNAHVGTLQSHQLDHINHKQHQHDHGYDSDTDGRSSSRGSASTPSPPNSQPANNQQQFELYQLRSNLAQQYFTPLINFLSAPHSKIRILHLNQNSIDDLFIAYLSEGLRHSTSIIELSLDHNRITAIGADLLAAALGGKRKDELAATQATIDAATAAAAALEDTSRSTSRQGNHPNSTKPAAKPVTMAKTTTAKKSKEVEPEPEPVEPITSQPLPTFTTIRTNHSLKYLSLKSNWINVEGCLSLESLSRHHPELIRCQLDSNHFPTHEQSRHHELRQQINQQCLLNAKIELRAIQQTFLLGCHRRVGAHSSIQVLVNGAKEQANHDSPQTNRLEQLTSQIPNLSFVPPSTSPPAYRPSSSSTYTQPHAHILHAALKEVWEFIGYQQ